MIRFFQVVLAMRDLFQVVFELKKKEIELARQHIQSKTIHEHQPVTLSVKSSIMGSSSPPSNKISHEPSTSKNSHKEVNIFCAILVESNKKMKKF